MKSGVVSLACILLVPALTPGQSASSIAPPEAMAETECSGSVCVPNEAIRGIWTFSGILGEAKWNNGAEAKVIIDRLDSEHVEIRRIDVPNSASYGLTAVYNGTLEGDRMEGTVVWSWNGHWRDEHPVGHWSAQIQKTISTPSPPQILKVPSSIEECESDQCAPGRPLGCRWNFHGNEGESHCRDGASARLVVEKFDSDGIVIRRTDLQDTPSAGLTALYTGTLHGDRIDGIGTWSWPGHWNNHNPSGKWFATIVATASQALPPVPPPLVSPEVYPDGSITFRAFAPSSTEMFVHFDYEKPMIMEKDDLGVWSLTTKPREPDYYGYIFEDAGKPVIDPSNPLILPNLLQTENMVHVPGPASLPWEIDDGPHGELHHHFYKSAAIGDERDFYVYTPPGYDAHAAIKYPVLYLLHGFGQYSSSWIEVAFANRILDHLIDEGKAKPMIVVMPTGYGGRDILAPGAYWNDDLRNRNFGRFAKSLFSEVMPAVDHEYSVATDRNSTAIAGLSMGGAQSVQIGLNNLDKFAWVGTFSSGGLRENFAQEFPGFGALDNSKLRLLWVACGVDDPLLPINRAFNKWLTDQGITHTYIETAGAHTWLVWRRNLAALAPLLFR